MQSPVKIFRSGSVQHIVLARPEKRNAFDDDTVAALAAEAAAAGADPAVRVIVLEGEGPAFCAGADIAWMRDVGARSTAANESSALAMARMYRALDRSPRPLIGRIHGACFGGGVGLAAVCDVVVAEAQATFAASEVRLGILPAVIGPYLARKLGAGRCRDLFLTGRRFGAEEAREIGLVHRVAALADLDAEVGRVIEDILAGAPGAQSQIKRFIAALETSRRDGDDLDAWTAAEIARARAGEEGRAGLDAFLAKRAPPWARER